MLRLAHGVLWKIIDACIIIKMAAFRRPVFKAGFDQLKTLADSDF